VGTNVSACPVYDIFPCAGCEALLLWVCLLRHITSNATAVVGCQIHAHNTALCMFANTVNLSSTCAIRSNARLYKACWELNPAGIFAAHHVRLGFKVFSHMRLHTFFVLCSCACSSGVNAQDRLQNFGTRGRLTCLHALPAFWRSCG